MTPTTSALPSPDDPLSFPAAEAEILADEYRNASVILEYGSGSSTLFASKLADKRVFSVESDRGWAHQLQACIDEMHAPSPATVHYVDIGPTGKWGRPVGPDHWARFHLYPTDIWSQGFFRNPDVVLVDGRFRTACLMTVGLLCKRRTRVLFDDYHQRKKYHRVEKYFPRERTVGRMAIFNVEPGQLTVDQLPQVLQFFTQATYDGQKADYEELG